jgi:hypothetical protein
MAQDLWKDDQNEELGDWRIEQVGRLVNDLPAAYPGGPSHKAGSPIYPKPTLVRHPVHNVISFVTANPTALALSIAVRAADEAQRLRRTLAFIDTATHLGGGKGVANENLTHLYDYFEHFMTAVTFSFQALETFSNWVISNSLKTNFQLERRGEMVEFTPMELERVASTEEKLAVVLPTVLGVQTPKGKKVWQNFAKLKQVRDSTIHLKSYNAYTVQIDKESLFYQFLNSQARELPKTAFEMIEYFFGNKDMPRWALYARRKIK